MLVLSQAGIPTYDLSHRSENLSAKPPISFRLSGVLAKPDVPDHKMSPTGRFSQVRICRGILRDRSCGFLNYTCIYWLKKFLALPKALWHDLC